MIEGAWINIVRIKGRKQLTVCNLYRSPNSNIKHFRDNIIKFLENYIDVDRFVILGDFNVDVSKNNNYAKKLVNECAFLGLKQKITKRILKLQLKY